MQSSGFDRRYIFSSLNNIFNTPIIARLAADAVAKARQLRLCTTGDTRDRRRFEGESSESDSSHL